MQLRFNPFVHRGYRKNLTFRQCVGSMFRWHNETGNIHTHVFGMFWLMTFSL